MLQERWIPYFWVQLVGLCTVHPKEAVNPFSDDVIIEILLRLPAEHVLQCRTVCRQWRKLTSTPYFIELHLKRASPSLLLQAKRKVGDGVESDLFIFEEASNEEAKFSKIPRNSLTAMQHSPWPSCTFNGLVVLSTTSGKLFIVNPITREELAVTPPGQPGRAAGIFFNSLRRDYELLCWNWTDNCCNYFIYSLGAKSWRKITSYKKWPTEQPIILKEYLYWMVGHNPLKCSSKPDDPPCPNAILVYSIDREDFHVLPCPEQKCILQTCHRGKNRLVINEQLYLCYMKLLVLDLWVLENYQNCSWIKTHSLDLNVIISSCPSFIVPSGVPPGHVLTLLGIRNEELLFDIWGEGSFRYNLKLETVKEITTKRLFTSSTKRGMGQAMVGGLGSSFICYTKSLVKLN